MKRPPEYLTRTDLEAMGFGRRDTDRIFEQLPVVVLPGSRRPRIARRDLERHIEAHTFTSDTVRPGR